LVYVGFQASYSRPGPALIVE